MTQLLIYKRWPAEHPDTIQLYSMNTPNGIKISVALEEMEISYDPHTVNILKGDQFTDEYKSVSPNSKIPAIVDPNGPGGKSIAIMESGAILIYLAEKVGKLLPSDPIGKNECLQWLFFQVGHIGPTFGQFGHFYKFAADKCKDPYPRDRYLNETKRLLAVIDRRLNGKSFIMGREYTIADIAIFPWVNALIAFYGAGDILKINEFENLQSWLKSCLQRPAYLKGSKVCSVS